MADNKKYYYIKLQENFFEREEILMLESIENGHMYSNILLKLYLKSLKNEGKLMFNNIIPYTPEILAKVIRVNKDTMVVALKLFQEFGLIEVLDNGAIYISDIQNFIGRSSDEADRKRAYRKQIEDEKGQLSGHLSLKCPDKTPPEKEKEKEKELDIKKEKEIEKDIELDKKHIVQQVDTVWARYPLKKGKATAMKKIPKLIEQYGYEQLIRCIERYDLGLQKETWRKPQNGSTFFNSGYVDYLDENYQEGVNNNGGNSKSHTPEGNDPYSGLGLTMQDLQ